MNDIAPVPAALTSPCPRCKDGIAFAGNHPGGGVHCDVCDGEDVVPIVCDLCGEFGAEEFFQGRPFHSGECIEEARANTLWAEEHVA